MLQSAQPILAIDPEGASLSYNLIDTHNYASQGSTFEFMPGSNILRVAAANFDFETINSYTFQIQAQVTGSSITSTSILTIIVEDIDEPPVFSTHSYVFTIDENTAAGTEVLGNTSIYASDPEGTQVFYALLDTSQQIIQDGNFKILSGESVIRVSETATLDAEENTTYSYKIKAFSSGSTSYSVADVVIHIANQDEAPVFQFAEGQNSYTFSVDEYATEDTEAMGMVAISATDPEGQPVEYSLLNAAGNNFYEGPFKIVEANQQQLIQVKANTVLDAEQTPYYTLKVQARTAGSSEISTADIYISITNLDEAPIFSALSYSYHLNEDADINTKANRTDSHICYGPRRRHHTLYTPRTR